MGSSVNFHHNRFSCQPGVVMSHTVSGCNQQPEVWTSQPSVQQMGRGSVRGGGVRGSTSKSMSCPNWTRGQPRASILYSTALWDISTSRRFLFRDATIDRPLIIIGWYLEMGDRLNSLLSFFFFPCLLVFFLKSIHSATFFVCGILGHPCLGICKSCFSF